MKKLFIALCFAMPVMANAQCDCSKLIEAKEDKVEGKKTIQNARVMTFYDSIDQSTKLECFTFIDIMGDVSIVFACNKSIVVRPDDAIKILFSDNSKVSFDEHYNEHNYKGRYFLSLTKKHEFDNSPIPVPASSNTELMQKQISTIRFYSMDKITDINLKSEDAILFQNTLKCIYEKAK